MPGDPNSIVNDAAESSTKVTKLLIFVFMEHYDFSRIFSADPEARTERTTAAETGFYILSVIMQTSLWLAISRGKR